MNSKMIFHTLGNILKVVALLLVFPLIVSFIYKENNWLAFLIPIVSLLIVGFLLTLFIKPTSKNIYAKEGLFIVGIAWIIISLFSCLPFVISKEIPSFIDAFFETVSGYTTTGASILNDPATLSHSMLFLRSFTHFIGGMGVLVFVLAIMPKSDGKNVYLLKAESTGPQVSKLVSKVGNSARILYIIYIGMTLVEMILLIIFKMPLFDAIVNSFATAGTGGFAIKASSIGSYSNVCQIIIAIFMMLFGINFNVFFFILIGKFKDAFKNEELIAYISIIVISTIVVTINLYTSYSNAYQTLGLALKDSFFQVSSIITTTGFATTDFSKWPLLSKSLLFVLMFIGGCAGSTGGGIKVSRIHILIKSIFHDFNKLKHRNVVKPVKIDGNIIDDDTIKGVSSYFALIMMFIAIGIMVISIDKNVDGFETAITSVVTCINNVGPGLSSLIGPCGNFGSFTWFSKLVLITLMLIGRLEIYPLLILFNFRIWKK